MMKMRNTHNYFCLPLKAVVVALCLMLSSVAMAEIGFWSSKATNMYIFTDAKSDWTGEWNGTGESPRTWAGYHSRMSLGSGTWVKLWGKTGSDKASKVQFKYILDNWGQEKEWLFYWDKDLGDNNYMWTAKGDIPLFNNSSANAYDHLEPGPHYLRFYYRAEAANYSGECWLSNGNMNYEVDFTVPGIVGSNLDCGGVKYTKTGSKTYTFKYYGNASSCKANISGTNASVFSFSNSSTEHNKTGISINNKNECSVTIYFTPAAADVDYTATITLKDANDSYEKSYNITGTGLSGVKLARANPAEPLNGPKALLSGYIKSSGCYNIKEYGFVYGTSTNPTVSNTKIILFNNSDHPLGKEAAAGTYFEGNTNTLSEKTTYYYRVYAITTDVSDNTFYSDEGTFMLEYDCVYPDPVDDYLYVTVDGSQSTSKCDLRFETITEALNTIKTVGKYYSSNDANGILLTNLVLEIVNTGSTYTEATTVGITGGKATGAECIKIENFNKTNPTKRLYLRGRSKTDRPTLQHLVLRNSKNISLENLKINGRETAYSGYHDNAMDIDNASNDWAGQTVGAVSNADIRIKGCYIKSWGFTCLHISAYDGIYIEDCDIEADYSDGDDTNAIRWGSSIKFIHCKNIKMLRNSFRGSHATSTWIQGCNHILLMNNVFWNSNKVSTNVAFVRLVCQNHDGNGCNENVSNVGLYYNTFYLDENKSLHSSSDSRKVDFFRLGSWYNGDSGSSSTSLCDCVNNYDHETIEFMYNNCYSYDYNSTNKEYCVTGRNLDAAKSGGAAASDGYPFIGSGKLAQFCGHINFNNFWSKYDKKAGNSSSAFAISPSGCSPATTTKFIDVEAAVCETASSDPGSLVLKTDGLNLGASVSHDVSGMGAESIFTDRLHTTNVRPSAGSKGGGSSEAGSDGANGTMILSVNDNITSATKDIDLTAYNLAASSNITCAITGTGSQSAPSGAFTKSHETFTVDASGNLSTKVFTVTFNRGSLSASSDPYTAVLTFTSTTGEVISINLNGYYNTDKPVVGGWSLGAYQMSHGERVSVIVWNGGSDESITKTDWDNRNNWVKLDGSPVTCVDLLDENLTVIIPAPEKSLLSDGTMDEYPRPAETGKIKYYPIIPVDFNDNARTSTYGMEMVNAGQGIHDASVTKFASTIEMQGGAAIKGVEHLMADGVRRYDEASNFFTAARKKWLLVGTVIQPFSNDHKTEVRNIKSNDFYLDTYPQVYMHEAGSTGTTVSWDKSFEDLNKEVSPDKVFAVLVANEYGKYKLSAQLYAQLYGDVFDGTAPIAYSSKSGWFYNESSLPDFVGAGTGNAKLVCNTYPANLDIAKLRAKNTVNVYKYNYTGGSAGSFTVQTSGEILSQNGFAIESEDGVKLTVETDMFTDNLTLYKSAEAERQSIRINLRNNTVAENGSDVLIEYDELKTDVFTLGKDASKIFITTQGYENVPDIYILRYNKSLAAVTIPSLDDVIPLGVKLKKNMTVRFSKMELEGFAEAVLTDVNTGVKTNLLTDDYTVELLKGVYEDRFFLNLKPADDVPTVVDDSDAAVHDDIYISCKDRNVALSATPGVILKDAYVTDMAGKTYRVKLKNAHYNELRINGSDGVYIINAVGDNMNKTEKVIIK